MHHSILLTLEKCSFFRNACITVHGRCFHCFHWLGRNLIDVWTNLEVKAKGFYQLLYSIALKTFLYSPLKTCTRAQHRKLRFKYFDNDVIKWWNANFSNPRCGNSEMCNIIFVLVSTIPCDVQVRLVGVSLEAN